MRLSRIGIALPHTTRRREEMVRGGRMPGLDGGETRARRGRKTVSSLRLEDRACRRLVGDQPVEEPPLQRRPDGRNHGTTDRRSDGQGLGRYPRWNAGEAKVCPAFDEVPL